MSLVFSGTGGGFTRLGRILHMGYLLTPYESSLPAAFLEIFNQYLTTLEAVGGSVQTQADSLTRTSSQMMGFASTAAQNTVQLMVQADSSNSSQAPNLYNALVEWIRQMVVQGVTVQANQITITPTKLPTFTGGGLLITSTKRGDGLVQENSVPETLRLTCTADSYTGGAVAGQEQFTLTGQAATAGIWDYDYPTGSGASASVRAISAAVNANINSNLLTNSQFENWGGTTPGPTATLNNWTLGGASVWGTDIRQNTTNPLSGTFCLEFIQGTGVNSQIYQAFGTPTTGTQATPKGLNSYAVNVWLRALSGTVTGGVLTIELVNSSGTVTQDEQGNNNSTTITLSALTTTYAPFNAIFRLNGTPPSPVWLRFRMSTALTGAAVLMDDATYASLTAMYQGGPGFAVVSDPAIPFVQTNDAWNIAVTNDYGGASYLGTFQSGFDRLFSMKSLNLLLPSSVGSPTVPNSLISAA